MIQAAFRWFIWECFACCCLLHTAKQCTFFVAPSSTDRTAECKPELFDLAIFHLHS
ncbi:hypothetical protein SEVIR_2G374950v4 [Setaria viridis]